VAIEIQPKLGLAIMLSAVFLNNRIKQHAFSPIRTDPLFYQTTAPTSHELLHGYKIDSRNAVEFPRYLASRSSPMNKTFDIENFIPCPDITSSFLRFLDGIFYLLGCGSLDQRLRRN
jgi:hypothetical protein